MAGSEYYCLVAGLKEFSLDTDNKGLEINSIIEEILSELSERDATAVRLLYTYYDCENLAAARGGRAQHNALGNLSREEIEEQLKEPTSLPKRVCEVVRAFSQESSESEEIDTSSTFEKALFEAYFAECAVSSSPFIRRWSQTDRNLRNVAAAIAARANNTPIEECIVGEGEIADLLRRSSASDFGLRGELPYIDAVLAAINDEPNIVEKEHKIDNIRWSEVDEASTFDYFNLNAILAYLVKLNIVARWSLLDESRGREMLKRLMDELSAKDKINK